MQFNTLDDPLDKSYVAPIAQSDPENWIEKPVQPSVPMGELGASVTEGQRFGSLIQSATGSIRAGTGKIELNTIPGGGEPGGAESYGKQARQAIREVARANQVEFTSVHAPPQVVGNLSGFNPQQGFSDEQRKQAIDEVKRSIDFSADATGGGAVVVHTGEYQRRISEAEWAKDPNDPKRFQFLGYDEEPGRAITYLVDDRTGQVIKDVRKSQVLREPIYRTSDTDTWGTDLRGNRVQIRKGDWIDQDGNFIDPSNPNDLFRRVPEWNPNEYRFETKKLGWNEIKQRADWYNDRKNPTAPSVTPEEMAFRIQMENQVLQARGQSLYYAQRYEEYRKSREELLKLKDFYKDLEKRIPPEEQWKIMRQDQKVSGYISGAQLAGYEDILPSQLIDKGIRDADMQLKHIHEASAAADARAEEVLDTIEHVVPMDRYAKQQSFKSYAELGIYAMKQTETNPHAKKDIFIAPENIFPEMGYGAHPEELYELVTGARNEMVKTLTKRMMPDPYGRRDTETGELIMVENPNYNPNISVDQAKHEAQQHIKATFDTQHLGMWRKNFVPRPGESKDDTDKRFNKWYMDQIEKLGRSKIIGHIHLVDSLGGAHHHLPAGQGSLPLVDAVSRLKELGFDGTIVSEGYEEDSRFGMHRQMTQTWQAFGSPIYSTSFGGGPNPQWRDVQYGYFGQNQPPMFIYGAYSPSNEWTLWSQVPME